MKTKVDKVVKLLYSMFRGDRYAYGVGGHKTMTDKPLSWWLKQPEAKWDITGEYVTANTFLYLIKHLTLDKVCDAFNKKFKVMGKWDSEQGLYGVSAEAEQWLLDHGVKIDAGQVFNTYNYENTLDHTLQYAYVTLDVGGEGVSEPVKYVLLQVHKGGDVRGNYTDAKMFRFKSNYESEAFINSTPEIYGTMTTPDGKEYSVSTSYYSHTLAVDESEEYPESTKVEDIIDKEHADEYKFSLELGEY